MATTPVLSTTQPWDAIGISRSQWYKLDACGRTPSPNARLGERTLVWLLSDLQDWLAAGGPDRETWEKVQQEAKKGK